VTNLEAHITAGEKTVSTPLAHWNARIEALLAEDRAPEALPAIRTVLRRLPQHLTTYQRLLEVAWRMGRWEEGHDWGSRLLRADPGNARAWRALRRARFRPE
jgi:predicted Zn-dependent protease